MGDGFGGAGLGPGVAGALKLRSNLCELVFSNAVNSAKKLLETGPAVTEKVADDDPAATLADAGAFSAVLLENNATLVPVDVAG